MENRKEILLEILKGINHPCMVAGGYALSTFLKKDWTSVGAGGSDIDIFIPVDFQPSLKNPSHEIEDLFRERVRKHIRSYNSKIECVDQEVDYHECDSYCSEWEKMKVDDGINIVGSESPGSRLITKITYGTFSYDVILAFVKPAKNDVSTSFPHVLDSFDLDICRIGMIIRFPMSHTNGPERIKSVREYNRISAINAATLCLKRFGISKDVRWLINQIILGFDAVCWDFCFDWVFGESFNRKAALYPHKYFSIMQGAHTKDGNFDERYKKYTNRGFRIAEYPSRIDQVNQLKDEKDVLEAQNEAREKYKKEKRQQKEDLEKREIQKLFDNFLRFKKLKRK